MIDRSDRAGEPERLAQEDPRLGELIERANAQYARGLDEAAAYLRVAERLEPRPRNWRGAAVGLALGFGAGAAVVWGVLGRDVGWIAVGPELSIGKEQPRQAAPGAAPPSREQLPAPSSPLAEEREPRAPPEAEQQPGERAPRADEDEREPGPELARESSTPREARPRARPARQAAREPLAAPEPPAGSAEAEAAPRADCLELARQGEPRAAEGCFSAQAAGSGLGAEVALYEMARLRRDVLRDPRGALAALEQHRQRFPGGSLRHEVAISHVELLSQLGRSQEALRESEALLATPSGRERAAELHLLRGNIYRHDVGDVARAAREYEAAERLGGPLGLEATRLRGASLEALGDVPGALRAYARYLESGEAPRRAEVSRRVEALRAGAGLKLDAP